MTDTSIELKWLRNLLRGMSVLIPLHIHLYCDNKSVISITTNLVLYERNNHIEVDCHVIRLKYTAKKIVLPYIPSKEQAIDIFTKV